MINVTVGWLLYERTGDAWALGLVGVAELAPVLLLMVVSGNAADRYPRRNIGILAHTILTIAATGLALLSYWHGPTWAIYSLLAMIGTARAFASPSVNTILPQLLAPEEFANANAWLSSTFQLAAISGPAIGGLLIAATGTATLPFALAGVGQLIFIAMLTTMPVRLPPKAAQKRSAKDVFAGFSFVRSNPLFLAAITLDLFAVLFGGAVALLPIYAKDILQVGPTGLGWLRGAPGVGALTMALITTRLKPWAHPGRVLLLVVVGFGAATIGFALRSVWSQLRTGGRWAATGSVLLALSIVGLGDLLSGHLLLPQLARFLNHPRASRALLGSRAPVPPFSTPLQQAMIRYTAFGPHASKGDVAFYERMLIDTPPDARAAVGAALSSMDLRHAVASITVPTLVIDGADDRLTPPAHARRIAEALPYPAGLLELPETGHMSPLERPHEVAEALQGLVRDTASPPVATTGGR